jgi:hypothetical protein
VEAPWYKTSDEKTLIAELGVMEGIESWEVSYRSKMRKADMVTIPYIWDDEVRFIL